MTTIITDIPGIGPSTAKVLGENGFKTVEEIAGTTVEKLSKVPGFGAVRASAVIRAANGPLSTSRPRRATTAISRIRPIRKKVAPVKSDVKKKKLISEKQKKEKQRKEKQRKEKLRKEKQRKEKLRKEKLRKEKLRKEKQRKEKLRKEKLRKEKQSKEKTKKKKSPKKKPTQKGKK